jgi:UDP-N-acetyl-D-galactosamine dehydrogenase
MGIDTEGVLKAAGTKWNFLPFKPGLVGGHCIGVDPYYLTYKAESVGYLPEIILSGRRLNDAMSAHVVGKLSKELIKNDINVKGARILVMGIAFKENCPDIRNSKVVDVVYELQNLGCEVSVYDPLVSADEVETEYGITTIDNLKENSFDAIIIAVGHRLFKEMGIASIRKFGREDNILFDLKYIFDSDEVDLKL